MKANRFIFMIVFVMALLSMTDSDIGLVQAKQKGKTRYSTRAPRKPQLYKHPKWMDEAAFFMDSIFDWFGYHEIPHTMRYAFILGCMGMPIYAFFFFWCCLHNDEYDDEVEEAKFKERVGIAFDRKKQRLAMAKQLKFD